jgi:hypothetical protein
MGQARREILPRSDHHCVRRRLHCLVVSITGAISHRARIGGRSCVAEQSPFVATTRP